MQTMYCHIMPHTHDFSWSMGGRYVTPFITEMPELFHTPRSFYNFSWCMFPEQMVHLLLIFFILCSYYVDMTIHDLPWSFLMDICLIIYPGYSPEGYIWLRKHWLILGCEVNVSHCHSLLITPLSQHILTSSYPLLYPWGRGMKLLAPLLHPSIMILL